jgi:putative SOS response-associated peptidase YedK
MCGRYRLDEFWLVNAMLDRARLGIDEPEPGLPLYAGTVEAFPRTFQPIIRKGGADLVVEQRRWGFHRMYPDAAHAGQWKKVELINAKGETAHRLPTFKRPR